MKKLSFLTILSIICLFFPMLATSQLIRITQSHKEGVYHTGDTIRLQVQLTGNKPEPLSISIRRNYNKEVEKKQFHYAGDTLLVFSEKATGPSSIIVEITTAKDTAAAGLVIDPEKFTVSTTRPADFDTYWEKEKKELKALPMQVKSDELPEIQKGYHCFNTEINCTGPKPARGYFAKPDAAQPGTLPIVIFVHAAGVSGNWCRSEPGNALRYAKMGKGALCFDLNAHGMLTGQPEQYYVDLEKGELNNYPLRGLEDRNTVYFRGMYLRLLRTLDYLTSQPEWDGKRILVIGESQGGGQSLAAAGLDPRVSAVVATVPAMCDWGRTVAGSKGGWPNPFAATGDKEKMMKALPYYDAAHLLKNAKATIVTEIGLIDFTCSSESVYAAVNQSAGKKIILPVAYRAHQMSQPFYKQEWEETITKSKNAFIQDFLK